LLFSILALALLLVLKLLVLLFRVRKGYFGTNSAEAREMIKFLIAHSENIDFNDPNGGLRRALSAELSESARFSPGGWQGAQS
jgi:hypothetical protein